MTTAVFHIIHHVVRNPKFHVRLIFIIIDLVIEMAE